MGNNLKPLPYYLIPVCIAQAFAIVLLMVLLLAGLTSPCHAKPAPKPVQKPKAADIVLTSQQVHELLLQWQKEPLPNLLRPQK